jgi:hypothetical protein
VDVIEAHVERLIVVVGMRRHRVLRGPQALGGCRGLLLEGHTDQTHAGLGLEAKL